MIGQLPTSISAPDVSAFTKLFGLTDTPVFLAYQDAGYGPDWCQVSAKHHALTHGGRRVHGWALWQYSGMVMGDFHSVWEDGEKLIDVTPPKFEASQVLFVRDRVTDIYEMNSVFVLPTNRSSLSAAPFWWNGQTTTEQNWGLPQDNPALIAYCNSLGFSLNAFITQPGAG